MFKRLYRLQLKYETETKHNIKETVPQDSQHIFFEEPTSYKPQDLSNDNLFSAGCFWASTSLKFQNLLNNF